LLTGLVPLLGAQGWYFPEILSGKGLDMKWMALGAALIAAITAQAPAAQATVFTFESPLGPEAAGATGSGSTKVVIDDIADELTIHIDWTGLSGVTTIAHIHCCTAVPFTGPAGIAVMPPTLPGFPGLAPVLPGLASGTYDSPVIDLSLASTYHPNFLANFGGGTAAGAEAALIAGLMNGIAYVNVHSTTFPGGEIRGFPVLTAVPEPSSLLIVAAALGGLGLMRRRKPVSRD
jgi:hypothetical protein